MGMYQTKKSECKLHSCAIKTIGFASKTSWYVHTFKFVVCNSLSNKDNIQSMLCEDVSEYLHSVHEPLCHHVPDTNTSFGGVSCSEKGMNMYYLRLMDRTLHVGGPVVPPGGTRHRNCYAGH